MAEKDFRHFRTIQGRRENRIIAVSLKKINRSSPAAGSYPPARSSGSVSV
jgi:hypothetical protein